MSNRFFFCENIHIKNLYILKEKFLKSVKSFKKMQFSVNTLLKERNFQGLVLSPDQHSTEQMLVGAS